MGRLYHSTTDKLRVVLRKKVVLFIAGFIVLLGVSTAFFAPLWQYVPLALSLGVDFSFPNFTSLRSDQGRTNILILGLDVPKTHPAARTDTMIFLSVDHQRQKSVMISLPRDIWISEMRAKINTAYYYGNQLDGQGTEWARKYISEILGQPIHYVVVVSFDVFTEIVDQLGGIDVEVERSFVDNRYPIPGKENDLCDGDPQTLCRYETISFEQGLYHLDGERSLKLARSRQAEGEEGTDFARSARQQKVILALKNKLLSSNFLLNPEEVDQMIMFLASSLEMNIPQKHMGALGRLLMELNKETLESHVLEGIYDNSKEPKLLEHPPVSRIYDNQWVLTPVGGDWTKTHEWVKCLLFRTSCQASEE